MERVSALPRRKQAAWIRWVGSSHPAESCKIQSRRAHISYTTRVNVARIDTPALFAAKDALLGASAREHRKRESLCRESRLWVGAMRCRAPLPGPRLPSRVRRRGPRAVLPAGGVGQCHGACPRRVPPGTARLPRLGRSPWGGGRRLGRHHREPAQSDPPRPPRPVTARPNPLERGREDEVRADTRCSAGPAPKRHAPVPALFQRIRTSVQQPTRRHRPVSGWTPSSAVPRAPRRVGCRCPVRAGSPPRSVWRRRTACRCSPGRTEDSAPPHTRRPWNA